jgi:HUS1 checkpoint protein
MRFKSKLAPEQIQILTSLITPISRMSGGDYAANNPLKSAASMIGGSVVHLDQQYIRFSARGGNTGSTNSDADGISCYVELACDVIFLDHKIESAANNAILFDINLAQLRTALQSVLSSIRVGRHQSSTIPSLNTLDDTFHDEDGPFSGLAASTEATFQSTLAVLKLAKRNGLPCLCLDCCGGSTSSMEVHHAIPVKVMRVGEMQHHLPPRIPNPDVQLELPIDRPIRTVIERLKMMSPHIYIEGCMAGELSFSIDGDGVSVRTYYNRLVPRFEECKASKEYHDNSRQVEEDDISVRCILKVDSKKLLSCLQWQSLLGRAIIHSAIICMVENEMLVLHVLLNPRSLGFFTYYIPVHFLSPDQLD